MGNLLPHEHCLGYITSQCIEQQIKLEPNNFPQKLNFKIHLHIDSQIYIAEGSHCKLRDAITVISLNTTPATMLIIIIANNFVFI